jgi:predicted aminopeptidase
VTDTREAHRAAGYEPWINEVDAYSTLGWFRDPVMNTFVHRDEVDDMELLKECDGDFGLFWKRVKGMDRAERVGGGF